MKLDLKRIESLLVELNSMKDNWQEMSYLLNYCQDKEIFRQKYDKYTYWLESLKDRGLSRSTLIRIKSAGEGWLLLAGHSNIEKIKECPVKDSMILTRYLSIRNNSLVSHQKLKAIENRIALNTLSRMEIESLLDPPNEDKVKLKLRELRDLIKDFPHQKNLLTILNSFENSL